MEAARSECEEQRFSKSLGFEGSKWNRSNYDRSSPETPLFDSLTERQDQERLELDPYSNVSELGAAGRLLVGEKNLSAALVAKALSESNARGGGLHWDEIDDLLAKKFPGYERIIPKSWREAPREKGEDLAAIQCD